MFNRYLGKIASIIKRDGFFTGIKIILQMFFVLVKKPKAADILFVSSGAVGDSWRYRVKNVAAEIELHGISSEITVQENIWLKNCADKFKVFIFHRVQSNAPVSELIEKIKKQGKEIIFETDDLLFDPKYIQQQDFFKNINQLEKKFFENGIGGEILTDPYVKTCTTTTSFLAEKLRECDKKVFIIPNNLSKEDIEVASKIQNSIHQLSKKIRIGYFSGGLSHNKDFATITGVLMKIMEKHTNVELFLAGPLDMGNELNRFSDRIKQMPYVQREKHFANIASVDINIAPLEIGNPFCEAKSELKFFEAGIVRVPTVAAATQTFKEAIVDGENGFVASGEEEWFAKIEKLIVDEKLRKDMGEKAYQKAINKYSVEKSNNEEYYSYLKNKIK